MIDSLYTWCLKNEVKKIYFERQLYGKIKDDYLHNKSEYRDKMRYVFDYDLPKKKTTV